MDIVGHEIDDIKLELDRVFPAGSLLTDIDSRLTAAGVEHSIASNGRQVVAAVREEGRGLMKRSILITFVFTDSGELVEITVVERWTGP